MRQILFANKAAKQSDYSGFVEADNNTVGVLFGGENPDTAVFDLSFLHSLLVADKTINGASMAGDAIAAGVALIEHDKYQNIVLTRAPELGGNVVIPFFFGSFTKYTLTRYAEPIYWDAIVDFSEAEVNEFYDYTVIVVKKGVKFNERNRWTFTHRATAKDTPETIAKVFAKYVTDNEDLLGLRTYYNEGDTTVELEAIKENTDYAIVFADELSTLPKVEVDYTYGVNTIDQLKDLAWKAAADAGFTDTYRDANLYPGLQDAQGIDLSIYENGAYIITIVSEEPRMVKTRDEVVKQVIQIVLPSSWLSTVIG